MERSIIHSDLKKQEVNPSDLVKEYLSLLQEDIRKLLPVASLREVSCPMSGEPDILKSFSIMGMDYQISKTFRNIYLSPRPSIEALTTFYMESKGRRLWLTELWPQTMDVRRKKIILPQLEWAQGFLAQYATGNSLTLAEFLPTHWGYSLESKEVFPNSNYRLVDILFNPSDAEGALTGLKMVEKVENDSLDAAMLFEALDRSLNPSVLLENVKHMLKPGALCFVTCLLSSGFEVQVLGKESEIFIPPERMNLFSCDGIETLVQQTGGLEVLEFSTPGVLDIPNVIKKLDLLEDDAFFK